MNAFRPLLLVKRPAHFILFIYLAVVTTFVQLNPRLVCDLLDALRRVDGGAAAAILTVVTLASLGVVISVFLPRYALWEQSVAAAVVHFIAFAAAAGAGVIMRLRIATPPQCPMMLAWSAILLVVVLTASVFTAVLNIVTPQKNDYAELRQRMLAYVRGVQSTQPADVHVFRELAQRAYDSAENARVAEVSPHYRRFVQELISDPLAVLLHAANETPPDHPEEFLKRIGQRDPGMAPVEAVERISLAQRKVERLCMAGRH